jgi:hypothetical protein
VVDRVLHARFFLVLGSPLISHMKISVESDRTASGALCPGGIVSRPPIGRVQTCDPFAWSEIASRAFSLA